MTTAVSRKTLTDQVADGILDLIVQRGLTAGEALPSSAELAKTFDVSVIVVREALASLGGRGVIDRRQGRETVVALPGSDILSSAMAVRARHDQIPLEDFLHCRAALESHVAGLAAKRGNKAEREAILRPVMEQLENAKSAADFAAADLEFHAAVASLSGNQAMVLILESLQAVIRSELYQRTRGQSADRRAASVEDHRRITKAVVSGDSHAASQAMAAHFHVVMPDFPL